MERCCSPLATLPWGGGRSSEPPHPGTTRMGDPRQSNAGAGPLPPRPAEQMQTAAGGLPQTATQSHSRTGGGGGSLPTGGASAGPATQARTTQRSTTAAAQPDQPTWGQNQPTQPGGGQLPSHQWQQHPTTDPHAAASQPPAGTGWQVHHTPPTYQAGSSSSGGGGGQLPAHPQIQPATLEQVRPVQPNTQSTTKTAEQGAPQQPRRQPNFANSQPTALYMQVFGTPGGNIPGAATTLQGTQQRQQGQQPARAQQTAGGSLQQHSPQQQQPRQWAFDPADPWEQGGTEWPEPVQYPPSQPPTQHHWTQPYNPDADPWQATTETSHQQQPDQGGGGGPTQQPPPAHNADFRAAFHDPQQWGNPQQAPYYHTVPRELYTAAHLAADFGYSQYTQDPEADPYLPPQQPAPTQPVAASTTAAGRGPEPQQGDTSQVPPTSHAGPQAPTTQAAAAEGEPTAQPPYEPPPWEQPAMDSATTGTTHQQQGGAFADTPGAPGAPNPLLNATGSRTPPAGMKPIPGTTMREHYHFVTTGHLPSSYISRELLPSDTAAPEADPQGGTQQQSTPRRRTSHSRQRAPARKHEGGGATRTRNKAIKYKMKRWLKAHGLHHTFWGDHEEWEAYRAEHPPQHQQRTQQQQDRGGGPRSTATPDVDWKDLLNRHNLPRTTQPPTPAGDKASNYHPHWQPPDPHDGAPTAPTQANTATATATATGPGGGKPPPPTQPKPPQPPQPPTLGGENSNPPPIPHSEATTTTHRALRSGKYLTRIEYNGDIPGGSRPTIQPTSISLPVNKAPRFSGETWFLLEPVTARQWLLTASGGKPRTRHLGAHSGRPVYHHKNEQRLEHTVHDHDSQRFHTATKARHSGGRPRDGNGPDNTATERTSSGEYPRPGRGGPKPSPYTRPPHRNSNGTTSGNNSPATNPRKATNQPALTASTTADHCEARTGQPAGTTTLPRHTAMRGGQRAQQRRRHTTNTANNPPMNNGTGGTKSTTKRGGQRVQQQRQHTTNTASNPPMNHGTGGTKSTKAAQQQTTTKGGGKAPRRKLQQRTPRTTTTTTTANSQTTTPGTGGTTAAKKQQQQQSATSNVAASLPTSAGSDNTTSANRRSSNPTNLPQQQPPPHNNNQRKPPSLGRWGTADRCADKGRSHNTQPKPHKALGTTTCATTGSSDHEPGKGGNSHGLPQAQHRTTRQTEPTSCRGGAPAEPPAAQTHRPPRGNSNKHCLPSCSFSETRQRRLTGGTCSQPW